MPKTKKNELIPAFETFARVADFLWYKLTFVPKSVKMNSAKNR
jgi:hypothetical protein